MQIPPSTFSTAAITNRTQSSTSPETGVRIEFKPGEDNVSSGNRSGNTLEVSISTPARQASTEVTRQQVTDRLETRLQKKALNQLSNGATDLRPLARKALVENTDINSSDIKQLATLRNQQRLAETYLNATPNNSNQANTTVTNVAASNNGANIYNQAVDAYVKQTLFFSSIENATSRFSTEA